MLKYIFNKSLETRKFRIKISMRSSKSRMGRFGGGWNWKVGFMAGGKTVIISLLVMDVRIEKRR